MIHDEIDSDNNRIIIMEYRRKKKSHRKNLKTNKNLSL